MNFFAKKGFRTADPSIVFACLSMLTIIYNERLVIWAHGFQDAGTPVGIQEDQLSFDGFSILMQTTILKPLRFPFAMCLGIRWLT